MSPRLIGVLIATAMACCLASCSSVEPGSTEKLVRFEINGSNVKVQVHDPPRLPTKGTVVVVDGSPESQPRFAADLTARLNQANYSVLTLPEVESMEGGQLSNFLRAVKTELHDDAKLSLFAFGDAGPGAWLALEAVEDLASTAFLVSTPLPSEPIDFAALSATGVRGVYAADSASYTSSYWHAHLAMRDLDTPHDFLIYGGEIEDDFYRDPSPLAQSTWKATMDAAVDWLSIWDRPESDQLRHHG